MSYYDRLGHGIRRHLTTTVLAATCFAFIGVLVFLQLTVHDPRHVLLTLVTTWGVLSLTVGLLFGHCALSSRE